MPEQSEAPDAPVTRYAYPVDMWTRLSRQSPDRNGRPHRGVDFFAPRGTPVRSMADGRVINRVDNWAPGYTGYGNSVRVLHNDGTVALYTHLDTITVALNQRVPAGTQLGTIGTSAGTRSNPRAQFARSRPHTHIEVHPDRRAHPASRSGRELDVRQWMADRGLSLTGRRLPGDDESPKPPGRDCS